jgi:hypothetical protein
LKYRERTTLDRYLHRLDHDRDADDLNHNQ